jgi:hypothetical protein
MCRGQAVAERFQLFIEGEALRDEINNGPWELLPKTADQDLARLLKEFDCAQVKEASGRRVQWWEGPSIRIQRWQTWDPMEPPTDWQLSVWSHKAP